MNMFNPGQLVKIKQITEGYYPAGFDLKQPHVITEITETETIFTDGTRMIKPEMEEWKSDKTERS